MFAGSQKSIATSNRIATLLLVVVLALAIPASVFAGKKKTEAAPTEKPLIERLDYSKIVWPNPPAITRIKYLDFYAAEKPPAQTQPGGKKGWMDRLSGVATGETSADKPLFQLAQPYGVAVDSKGVLYVADSKVGAIFIFNTETKDVELHQERHARAFRVDHRTGDGRFRPPLRF